MRKIPIVVICVCLLGVAHFGLSDMFITYKSGSCKVDVEGNGKWKDAAIDMELNSMSVIKTGSEGELEIEIEGETVAIGQDRVVVMTDILEKITDKNKIGWLKNMKEYAKRIGRGDETTASTALAGVRGDRTGEADIVWFEEGQEGEELIEELRRGRAYFEQGDYTKAIPIFTDIMKREEMEAFQTEIAFYLGVSLFNNLQYEEALPYLSESVTDRGVYYYELALIHYSIAHYFLKNYKNAIEGFNSYTEDFTEGEMEPYVLLMLGKCYKDIGERSEAIKYFTEVKQRYKDTEVYQDALAEMTEL